MIIPEDYIECLHWIKERTESHWNKKTPETGEHNDNWIIGAKWSGLDESEIAAIENKFGVTFTPDHKEFLKVLHAIDKKRPVEYYDEKDELYTKERPYFYNWLTDEDEIRQYIEWPYREILNDVNGGNKVWLKSWGSTRPKSLEDREKVFSKWFATTPKLTPILGHRFVVSEVMDNQSPVLSMYGSDIIVYGWNLKFYLLNELFEYLDLSEQVYDDEDEEWYSEPIEEYVNIRKSNGELAKVSEIPVWEEMILYWSSGWAGYGKEYPYSNNDIIQPIVKAFIPEDE